MSFADWVGALGGVVAIIGAIWAFGHRTIRRMGNFLDDWAGEPERRGVPARKGVMERLGDMERRILRIEQEVLPDHGRSMRDKVDRIDRVVTGSKGDQHG